MSGQNHDPAALTPGKEPWYPLDRSLGCGFRNSSFLISCGVPHWRHTCVLSRNAFVSSSPVSSCTLINLYINLLYEFCTVLFSTQSVYISLILLMEFIFVLEVLGSRKIRSERC